MHEVTSAAPRQDAWRAAVHEVGQWWSSDHTISGDASKMSIDPVPQGCFCEAIGEHAGVVHLIVTFVIPNVPLRLIGGLGLLGLLAVARHTTLDVIHADSGPPARLSSIVRG